MSKEHFRLKDYWALFKLSCRSYIYPMPLERNFRPFIAAVFIYLILIDPTDPLKHPWHLIAFLKTYVLSNWILNFIILFFIIINPYYFKYALHYKTSDWYLNTGYSPSDVCSDVGIFGEYHATMDFSNMIGNHGKVYNGLIIPKPDGSFTELDLVVISTYRISVVEVKARGGSFSGHVLDDKWIQKIGSQRNELQNPVIQNQNHINFLCLYLYEQLNKDLPGNIDSYSFLNDIYFALDSDIHVDNFLPGVTFLKAFKTFRKNKLSERYSLKDIKAITDVLDALPKYTPEEKRQMFTRREAQYRSGEFIHPVTYYPVKHLLNTLEESDELPTGTALCMDVETYQLYLGSDGLWHAVPGALILEKGRPCSTLQQATQLKKELGW